MAFWVEDDFYRPSTVDKVIQEPVCAFSFALGVCPHAVQIGFAVLFGECPLLAIEVNDHTRNENFTVAEDNFWVIVIVIALAIVIFIEYIDFGFVGQGEQISVFIWQFSRQVEILSVFLLGLVSDKRLIEDTVARINDLVTIFTT